jgi:ERCC4-related helicase
MRDFYHPAKSNGRPIPHVLGLTASPVVNAKQQNIAVIESNLDAVIVTPTEHRADLGKYVHRPELIKVEFDNDGDTALQSTGPLRSALTMAVVHYNLSTDPYVLDLESRSNDKSRKELAKILRTRKTFCFEQLASLETRAAAVLEQVGPTMAEWYIASCIKKFQRSEAAVAPLLQDLTDQEHKHIAMIFRSIMLQDASKSLDLQPIVSSSKAKTLAATLLSNASPSVRGIIFVEQRVVTTTLTRYLNSIPEIVVHYNIGSFVGLSSSTSRQARVADLVESKAQQTSLQDFRDGSKNLIIATNVLEEG